VPILNAMNLTKVYITGIIRVYISFSVPHREERGTSELYSFQRIEQVVR
jgi:hypothetical protein